MANIKNLNKFWRYWFIGLVILIAGYYWGENIYTSIWRLYSSEKIEWNNLQIKPPDNFIYDYINVNPETQKLRIRNITIESQPTIFLYKFKENFILDNEFAIELISREKQILEKNECEFFNEPCILIKSQNKGGELGKLGDKGYREDVFFYNEKYWVSYQGFKSDINYLYEILNNVSVKQ